MFDESDPKEEKDRSRPIMLLSAVAVVVVIGLIIAVTSLKTQETPLDIARAGSQEFDSYLENVKVGELDITTGERLANRFARLKFPVQNLGYKELTALQLRVTVLGLDGETKKEKIVTLVPTQIEILKPRTALPTEVNLEPIPDPSEIMDFKVEVYGLKINQ